MSARKRFPATRLLAVACSTLVYVGIAPAGAFAAFAAGGESQPVEFSVIATGDILLHTAVTRASTRGGHIDYSRALSGLDDFVGAADLALCHFETPIVQSHNQVTDFPVFGVPKEIVRDIAQQGWDGCSTASNHSIDKGFAGLSNTLAEFEKNGLGYAGTGRNKVEAQSPQYYILEREGVRVKVAHLAATMSTNGLSLPAGQKWAVRKIDTDKIISQARSARKAGADIVIVSAHDGSEYQSELTARQKANYQKLANSGEIDLVIGHHAHVPQRISSLSGGPNNNGMWVAYGLGNMISAMNTTCCSAESLGGLLLTTMISVEPDGAAQVSAATWTGITVDRGAGYKVLPIAATLENPRQTTLTSAELKRRHALISAVVGGAAKERTSPLQIEPAATLTVLPHRK